MKRHNDSLATQAIFTDLDGTLINGQKTVSDKNADAIRKFVAQGGEFSVATGRSELITPPFIHGIPVTLPAILYNGSAVYSFKEQRFLWKRCIDDLVVQDLLRLAISTYPEVCAEVFMGGPISLVNRKCVMDHYITQENQPYEWAKPTDSKKCLKILLYGEPSQLRLVEEKLLQVNYRTAFTHMFSAPFYFEILPFGTSKHAAIQWLLKNYATTIQSYSAIGDYYNDVEMVKHATFGAAPENAVDEVKKVSKVIVADNDNHALADLIENHILISNRI